jgi:hypothetical protein
MPPSRNSSNMAQVVEYIPGKYFLSSITAVSSSFYCGLSWHLLSHGIPWLSSKIRVTRSPFTLQQCVLPSTHTHSSLSCGPVSILIIADRLYLGAYAYPPTADTLFPFPEPTSRSPSKRSQRPVEPQPVSLAEKKQPCYFSVDDTLLYNAFHHDFGPLHVGHLYRFALQFHDILGAKENKDRPIVFWSRADPRSE